MYKKMIMSFIVAFIILMMGNAVHAYTQLSTNRVLKEGDIGEDVFTLQTMLYRISLSNSTLKNNKYVRVGVDGYFEGPYTTQPLKEFQRLCNLPQTGVVDETTKNKLNEVCKKYQSVNKIMLLQNIVIRQGPGQNYPIVTTAKNSVSKGSAYTAYELKKDAYNNGWYKIKYATDQYGWICAGDAYGKYTTKDFIWVDISDQMLRYFSNYKEIFCSPIVTGKQGVHDTPTGLTVLKYSTMQNESTLVGYNDDGSMYNQWVNYWMPFVGNQIGFHDANWQPYYGGTRYISNGSHGCINMPPSYAKKMYSYFVKNKKNTYLRIVK